MTTRQSDGLNGRATAASHSADIELWCDSFHEGMWASDLIAEALGGEVQTAFLLGFIPVTTVITDEIELQITVFGGYTNWTDVPAAISELLAWGKPDLIAYDRGMDRILFAVEETAAVPTGNQALQRCERMFGAARQGVPFWYLLSEFGVHLDGRTRRASIWPTLMAIKLTHRYGIPSVVLRYSVAASPEDYSAGTGMQSLFTMLAKSLRNYANQRDEFSGLSAPLAEQYKGMFAFVRDQAASQVNFIPDTGFESDERASAYLANRATDSSSPRATDFLRWPAVAGLPDLVRRHQTESDLIKDDLLLRNVERLRSTGRAYTLSSKAGSRPQAEAKLCDWIKRQNDLFENGLGMLDAPAHFSMRVEDFPPSSSSNRHVTTAKNVFYLIDRWGDLRNLLEHAYPRLQGGLSTWDDEQLCLLYVSNSVLPGRIFGDPFTGQIAAFATVFDKLEDRPRMVIAYFPHQAHGQITNPMLHDNKGTRIMAELTDLLIFHAGVGLDLRKGRWI